LLVLVSLLTATSLAALAATGGGAAQATSALSFTPVADAYVVQNKASSNYGTAVTLRADSSPITRSYLRFAVTGLNGASIQSAKLRLWANSTNNVGYVVRALADNTWAESKITYQNAPAPGAIINSAKAFASGAWIEVDVSSYVKSAATYNMVLTTTSTTNISLCSRESGGYAPQLVLTLVSSPTATATQGGTSTSAPTQTPTSAPDSTATSLPTNTPTTALTSTSTSFPTDTPTSVATSTATSLPTQTATTQPTATATAQADWQPTFPIRAAFYYPWFPEAWKQNNIYPYTNYTPQLGYYSSTDASILKQHIAMMQYGNIQAGIASWWGQGSQTDTKINGLLQAAAGTNFRWALYYELESQGDPTSTTIQNDLIYIRDHYGNDPSYLRVNGKFVVFVYADGNDACGMADRWKQANTVGAYVVLKVFSGYRNCASQPDSWHQYSPAVAADQQSGYSYAISPGFWLVGQTVRLSRDLTRWTQNVRDMVASGTNWELVTTFSEWGEGTAVEPALEWASSSGYGQYLDALHYNGNMP
jgi:hypothetical protein